MMAKLSDDHRVLDHEFLKRQAKQIKTIFIYNASDSNMKVTVATKPDRDANNIDTVEIKRGLETHNDTIRENTCIDAQKRSSTANAQNTASQKQSNDELNDKTTAYTGNVDINYNKASKSNEASEESKEKETSKDMEAHLAASHSSSQGDEKSQSQSERHQKGGGAKVGYGCISAEATYNQEDEKAHADASHNDQSKNMSGSIGGGYHTSAKEKEAHKSSSAEENATAGGVSGRGSKTDRIFTQNRNTNDVSCVEGNDVVLNMVLNQDQSNKRRDNQTRKVRLEAKIQFKDSRDENEVKYNTFFVAPGALHTIKETVANDQSLIYLTIEYMESHKWTKYCDHDGRDSGDYIFERNTNRKVQLRRLLQNEKQRLLALEINESNKKIDKKALCMQNRNKMETWNSRVVIDYMKRICGVHVAELFAQSEEVIDGNDLWSMSKDALLAIIANPKLTNKAWKQLQRIRSGADALPVSDALKEINAWDGHHFSMYMATVDDGKYFKYRNRFKNTNGTYVLMHIFTEKDVCDVYAVTDPREQHEIIKHINVLRDNWVIPSKEELFDTFDAITEQFQISSDEEDAKVINLVERMSHYLQVQCITDERIVLRLDILDKAEKSMKYRVCVVGDNSMKTLKTIVIRKKKLFGTASIDMEDIDIDGAVFDVAVYAINDDTALSNVVKLYKLSEDDDFPPNHYKPQSIDAESVIKAIDDDKVYLYWQTPLHTFGDKIAYKIVNDSDDEKSCNMVIGVLPYSVKLSDSETTIQIMTVCEIDDEKYYSDLSSTVYVGIKSQAKEDTPDALYKWCAKYGFDGFYESIIDRFELSLDDILQSSIDDLFDICNDLQFTVEQQNRFLRTVISNKESNALQLWCKQHRFQKTYDRLIENGYFSVRQIAALSRDEKTALSNRLGLKFGPKSRFLNNLPMMVNVKDRTIKQVEFTTNDEDIKQNRTLLFVGETGSGKTSTINSIMNYLFEAQFEGSRYRLITEKSTKKQTESQTSTISVYNLKPTAIDYEVTIVDTPGFGNCDANGIQFDQVISLQLEQLFKTQVTQIDAICFVIQAHQNRLNQRQEYVFRQVMNVFGNDVAENIVLLFTFDDGSYPPLGLAAVDNNIPKIPHRTNYFLFNNHGFKFDPMAPDESKRSLFNKSMEEFGNLFQEISTIETKSLSLSKLVLEQRRRLKQGVKTIRAKLQFGLTIHRVIMQKIREIERHKDEINKNSNCKIKVQQGVSKKVIVRKSYFKVWFAEMRSSSKKEHIATCRSENIDTDDRLKSFYVCERCKLTCPDGWILHPSCPGCNTKDSVQRKPYKYELVLKDITVPVRELQSGYVDATLNQPLSCQLIKQETTKLKQIEFDLVELVVQIKFCINEIKGFALNPSVLTTNDYFDILIEEEAHKSHINDDWKDRVNALQKLQQQQEVIQQIEKTDSLSIESIFPEFERISSFREEEEKKECQRIVNMTKKNIIDQKTEKARKRNPETKYERWWIFWKKEVYNYTYDDILKDFRGHIVKSDSVDRNELLPKAAAMVCCKQNIRTDKYMKCFLKNPKFKSQSLSLIQWRIYPLYTSWDGDFAVLSFNSCGAFNVIQTICAPPKSLDGTSIQVHSKMHQLLMNEFAKIMKRLDALQIGGATSKTKGLYITGGTIGGGFAVLMAYEMLRRGIINEETLKHCKYNVVTFGAPPVLAYDGDIAQIMRSNKVLKMLNAMCHAYVNRLDPIPRLIHLCDQMTDRMEMILVQWVLSCMKQQHQIKKLKVQARIQALFNKLKSNEDKDTSTSYFAVGKQYIWCGRHRKYYLGEEMRIRIRHDIVTSFGAFQLTRIPFSIWNQMMNDAYLQEYEKRLKSPFVLI
eukprot:209052_1